MYIYNIYVYMSKYIYLSTSPPASVPVDNPPSNCAAFGPHTAESSKFTLSSCSLSCWAVRSDCWLMRARSAWMEKFSNVNLLLNVLCTITIELTCEELYQLVVACIFFDDGKFLEEFLVHVFEAARVVLFIRVHMCIYIYMFTYI